MVPALAAVVLVRCSGGGSACFKIAHDQRSGPRFWTSFFLFPDPDATVQHAIEVLCRRVLVRHGPDALELSSHSMLTIQFHRPREVAACAQTLPRKKEKQVVSDHFDDLGSWETGFACSAARNRCHVTTCVQLSFISYQTPSHSACERAAAQRC